MDDLEAFSQDLIKDLDFIHSQMHCLCVIMQSLKSANNTYSLDKDKDEHMISLRWY